MAVPKSLEDKWSDKEKETVARIQLQELVASIDLLTEIKEGNFDVDGELSRLQELEKDCGVLVDSYPSLGWTIFDLDLPQVSEESDLGAPSNAGGDMNS